MILANVHQLLGRDELRVGASLDVGLGLAGTAKWLERGVVDELGVLGHLRKVDSLAFWENCD